MKKIAAKKLRELLADVQVHNERQLFKPVLPAPPVISYRKTDRHQFARWVVARSGHKTDPEHGHFLDGGNKIFPVTAATTRDGQFIRARDWASEKYGYTTDEWVKTPFGGWAPKVALESALWHYLPELFEKPTTTIYIPPTTLPDARPLDEVIKKTLVRDHEQAMGAALQVAVPVAHAHLSAHENTTNEDDTSAETDGWYRVVGANVAVFIKAMSEHDAKNRVEHMINRLTMDCDLNLHVTKRDPEVN